MRMIKHLKFLFIPVLLALLVSGCAPVKPWQKEHLALPTMAFDPDPLEARSRQHAFTSKEASFGGYGVGAGGCGCN
jgi:hypothetical protein